MTTRPFVKGKLHIKMSSFSGKKNDEKKNPLFIIKKNFVKNVKRNFYLLRYIYTYSAMMIMKFRVNFCHCGHQCFAGQKIQSVLPTNI